MDNLANTQNARRLAEELLRQAQENEPQVTADLQIVAQKVSAEIVGLEYRFKSKESLIRKLSDTANTNSKPLREIAEIINDVLRYTFILSFETYQQDFQRTIELLKFGGCTIPANRIWNAWKYIGSRRDKGYRGINITVISSQNQKFEIQFHTMKGYLLKTETHDLYKELRSKTVSEKREAELIGEMRKAASDLERPEGV